MMKGIVEFLQNNETDVKRIDIVTSSDVAEHMRVVMQEADQTEKEVFV